ncbi:YybH family protein [Acidobacteriota bacterium]
MKKLFMNLLLVLVLCFTFSCKNGEEVVGELDEAQKAKISETVKQLSREAYEMGSSNDLDRMYTHFSDKAITIEMGKIDYSWEHKKKVALELMANFEESKFIIDEMEVDVLSSDVAIVYGIYQFSMTDKSGNTFAGKNAWTWVFSLEEQSWKIRHIHVSTPLETN